MYLPVQFEESDPGVLAALVRDRPLATLVVAGPGEPSVDHVPLLLRGAPDGSGTLVGHVARANPLWRRAGNGAPCVAVFHGAEHYISPGWYASKQADPRVVPTWNYEVVHVHGEIRAFGEPERILGVLDDLTRVHEQDRERPWDSGELPPEHRDRLLQAVVGIEIRIGRVVGKSKLGQNQPVPNRRSMAEALRTLGTPRALALAGAVERALARGAGPG